MGKKKNRVGVIFKYCNEIRLLYINEIIKLKLKEAAK
jgi:hypothetical protein